MRRVAGDSLQTLIHVVCARRRPCKMVQVCVCLTLSKQGEKQMNNIIYIVGLIVIVLFILGFLGLR